MGKRNKGSLKVVGDVVDGETLRLDVVKPKGCLAETLESLGHAIAYMMIFSAGLFLGYLLWGI